MPPTSASRPEPPTPPASPRPARPYHHGNLRAALLEHAERMLDETGPDRLSLRELARAAGVSHGAPRRHFADKQALLDALAESGFARLGAELDAVLGGARGPFVRRLVDFARVYVDFAVRHPGLLALMHAAKDRPGSAPSRLREANDRAFAAPLALLEEARREGWIVADDPDRVAMAVLAVLQGLAVLVGGRLGGARPADSLVAGTVETLVEGLRPR